MSWLRGPHTVFKCLRLIHQELTTEEFILAFWLRYVVLPWKRGWLKTRLKKVFVYLKIVQSLDFFSTFADFELT